MMLGKSLPWLEVSKSLSFSSQVSAKLHTVPTAVTGEPSGPPPKLAMLPEGFVFTGVRQVEATTEPPPP